MLAKFFILLASIAVALAAYGVDLSQSTPLSAFQCARNYGYEFAIVRVYCSPGYPDSNGPSNINNAWNAGFAHVDGYIFPCYSCGNPEQQVTDTVNYLKSHKIEATKPGSLPQSPSNGTVGATYGMLWFDIEGTSYWSSSATNNINFLQRMVNQGHALGVSMGIYSSSSQWSPIMGGTSQFSSLPLWYAHWDFALTMSDYVPFGGWSKPAMKQYAGDQSFCSAGWDKNYY
jgi:hypothetical protein